MSRLGLELLVVLLASIGVSVFGQRCRFNGPQDAPTLRGSNFLTNIGNGMCLKIDRVASGFGGSRFPIKLDVCTWNNISPAKEQLFEVRNHNGGSIIKPTYDSSTERCATTFGTNLVATNCIPKNNDQTWIFNHVRGGMYNVLKRSNGRCLKAQSRVKGSIVVEAICTPADNMQLWRICTK